MIEIYLMTRDEWEKDCPDEARPRGAISPHRLAVLDAARRGLYVPWRVRRDYPDLARRYPELFARYGVGTTAGTARREALGASPTEGRYAAPQRAIDLRV